MEIARLIKRSRKAQMMTTAVLLMFSLMLAELFAFLILTSNYNSLGQSLSVATGSQGIGSSLQLGSRDFAGQSLQKAITVLAAYEYNPSLRRGNLVSNFSYYASNLMISGYLPNATSLGQNVVRQQMGGFTFNSYNLSVLKTYQLGGGVSINETRPQIYQQSSYTISVKYTENVRINSQAGSYVYSIPVNATLNLTGEPDLFYAQQGVQRYLSFANLSSQAFEIGGINGTAGSLYNFAYGTVNIVTPGASSCPTAFGSAGSNSIILVSQNAQGITSGGCANGFAGVISTAGNISGTPTIPYLGYPSNTNIGQLFKAGSGILLYGPGLSAFNIQNLRNSVANGYYFASPATASYMQRSSGQVGQSSQQGIFTFGMYNRQVGAFNGQTSYLETPNNIPTSTKNLTVVAWVDPLKLNGNRGIVGQGAVSGRWALKTFGATYDFVIYGIKDYKFGGTVNGTWTMLTAVFGSGNVLLYQNGQLAASYSESTTLTSNLPLYIGYSPSDTAPLYFNGSIANVQVYNASLSPAQISGMYREGIESLPVSSNALVGWWPLNGNANDYSGLGNAAGTGSVAAYALAPSGAPTISTGQFNGTSSTITTAATTASPTGESLCAWVNPQSLAGYEFFASTDNDNGAGGLSLASQTGSEFYGAIENGDLAASSSYVIGTWYLLCVAGKTAGNIPNFYVDGVLATGSSTAVSSGTAGGNLYFGSRPYSSAPDYAQAEIADVQLYSTVLSAAQVDALYFAGVNGAPIPGAGIVGWWPLNGNANDYSGSGSVGTPTNVLFNQSLSATPDALLGGDYMNLYPLPGVLSCSNMAGCYNASLHNVYLSNYPVIVKGSMQAAQFNGASSYISTGKKGLPTGGSQRSAFGWIYIGGSPSGNFLSYGTVASGELSALSIASGTGKLYFSGSADDYASSLAPSVNSWNFVGYTYGGGTSVTIYLNNQSQTGSLSGSALNTVLPTTDPADIGKESNGGAFYFNGKIANVQYYNSVLSATQANALYAEGLGGAPILPANVVGWWPLNGNDNDYSGNGNNGNSDQNVAYPYVAQNATNVASFWQALGFGVPPK